MEGAEPHLPAVGRQFEYRLVGDDELRPARRQAEIGARGAAPVVTDAGDEVDAVDEGPPVEVDDDDGPRHEGQVLRLGEAADETHLRPAVIPDGGDVEVAVPVDLGGGFEGDVEGQIGRAHV